MPKSNAILYATAAALGIFLIALSGLYISSFLAILGVTIVFWGVIFYYIKPTKQVSRSLIIATSISNVDNLNRIFSELEFTQKGIYLPPNKLQDTEASLVLIPQKDPQTTLSNDEITNNSKLFTIKKDGLLLSPPGYGLIKLMEQKLGKSFSKMDLQALQKQLPTLFVEDLEIAENVNIQTETNKIIFEIKGSIFTDECNQTQNHQQIHDSVGCILSSAIACVLAKVTGVPITINSEETTDKITKIIYQLFEEQ